MHMPQTLSESRKFDLRLEITDHAKTLGFDLVGFSPAKIEDKYLKGFEEWLAAGREGTMDYMRKIAPRRDINLLLPGAKTVIVFGLNYYHEQSRLPRGHGRVARYAYGRDYHKVIGKKLRKMEEFIAKIYSKIQPVPSSQPATLPKYAYLPVDRHGADFLPQKTACGSYFASRSEPADSVSQPLTKSYVDTGPILERAYAEQAGIGRIGKNGCVISKEFGSWIFLSEIITTLDLNFDNTFPGTESQSEKVSPGTLSHWSQTPLGRWSSPSQKSFNICGNCTKCMTACPTGAIIAPGVVDSRLCISYLTIENKDKIPPKLAKIIKKTKHLYGCDICQEVCPHNHARQRIKKSAQSDRLDGLLAPIAGDSLNIKKLPPSDASFLRTFAGSPVMRAKRRGLERTSKIIGQSPASRRPVNF